MNDRSDKARSRSAKSSEEVELKLADEEFPLERYKPIALLGTGTVGTVYLCKDRLLEKRVAVKVLKALSDEQLVSFQQEARATSRLSHRNIVKVLDFGATASGVPFMVMEYVEGLSLDQIVREEGALEVERALPILIKVCDALEYAHGRGIFHRDVKSSNVLVVDNSVKNPGVRLIDFGVAAIKLSTDDSFKVQGRTIVGTPQYMSPDQCSGLAYDEGSEVYSVGCVMFEALTGRPPFEGATALETIALHANEPPPTLAEVNVEREFDLVLEAVVARCLAKKREERYPSMAVLKADLQHCLAREQSASAESTQTPFIKKFSFLRDTSSHKERVHDRDPILTGIMIALICFSLTSWLAYNQIEKILSNKKTVASIMPNGGVGDHPLPALDEYVGERGFVRAYIFGRLSIQSNTTVKDEDMKELAGDPELTSLKLLAPVLNGRGFDYLSASKLSRVDLIEGQLTDECFDHLAKLKNLKRLELIACRGFTGSGLSRVSNLSNLAVTHTTLGDADLKLIAENMKGLETLDFSANLPVSAETIKMLPPSIWEFVISPEQLDDHGFEALAEMKSLAKVVIDGRKKLKDRNLLQLAKLPNLKHIGLAGAAVSDSTVSALKQFPQIKQVDLRGASLRDEQIGLLAGKKLRVLGLMETAVSDAGLNKVADIPGLEVLRLDRCTGISSRAVAELSKRLPACDIRVRSITGVDAEAEVEKEEEASRDDE